MELNYPERAPRTAEEILPDIKKSLIEQKKLQAELTYVQGGYFAESKNFIRLILRRIGGVLGEVVTPETHRNESKILRLRKWNKDELKKLLIEYSAANGDNEANAYFSNFQSVEIMRQHLDPIISPYDTIEASPETINETLRKLHEITWEDADKFEALKILIEKLSKPFPDSWPLNHQIELIKSIYQMFLSVDRTISAKATELEFSLSEN